MELQYLPSDVQIAVQKKLCYSYSFVPGVWVKQIDFAPFENYETQPWVLVTQPSVNKYSFLHLSTAPGKQVSCETQINR